MEKGLAGSGVFSSATRLAKGLQQKGFHVDINRLANNARHVLFNIDNPPDNLILFTENELLQIIQPHPASGAPSPVGEGSG